VRLGVPGFCIMSERKEPIFVTKNGIEVLNAKSGLCMLTGFMFKANEWSKREYAEARRKRGVDWNERRRKGYNEQLKMQSKD